MQITGSKVLILGGFGLVGSAVSRKLMMHNPAQIIIASLKKEEAESACQLLKEEYPASDPSMFVPKWGNLFTRDEWKDMPFNDVITGKEHRVKHIQDIFSCET